LQAHGSFETRAPLSSVWEEGVVTYITEITYKPCFGYYGGGGNFLQDVVITHRTDLESSLLERTGTIATSTHLFFHKQYI
jgi:hypothetical protein